MCRVRELFYAIVPTLFSCFVLFCYPYILLKFESCLSFFVSSRCMLDPKFVITELHKVCLHRLPQ